MRIAELKKIIDIATNNNGLAIKLEYNNMYNGHAFKIINPQSFIPALKSIIFDEWLKINNVDQVKYIIDMIDDGKIYVLDANQLNILNGAINEINGLLPILYGFIGKLSSEQEETLINIKIPIENSLEFDKLNDINKDLEEVFKLIILHNVFNADKVVIKGFDKGSNWYEVLIIGAPIAYYGFLGICEIANNLIEVKTTWYKSEDARINYEIAKSKLEKSKQDGYEIESFLEEWLDSKKSNEIKNLLKKINFNYEKNNELLNSLNLGLTRLIKLMEQGAEFHPSLNPPKCIEYNFDNANLTYQIDYNKLRAMLEAEKTISDEKLQITHDSPSDNMQ